MEEGFYRRLWRFNALVIAVIGVIGLAGLSTLVAFWVYSAATQSERRSDRAIGQAAKGDDRLVLGFGEQVSDTGLFVFRIGRVTDAAGGYGSSYREGDDRNVLVINERDASSRMVLPDNRRQITDWQVIGDKGEGAARAYVALVMAPAAGNGTSRSGDVLVGNFRTGRQAWLAKNVRSIAGTSLVDDDSVALTTVEGDRLMFRRIDLSTLTPRVVQPIPIGEVSTEGRIPKPIVQARRAR